MSDATRRLGVDINSYYNSEMLLFQCRG